MEAARKNLFSVAFWLLFSIYIAIESYRLGLGKWSLPGPGYFPFVTSVLLGMISLSLLVKTLLRSSLGKKEVADLPARLNWQNIVLTLVGMFVYVFLLDWMGFVLCTFFLMIFLILAVGRWRWFVSLIAALSITLVSYLLFEVLLDSHLPKGFLGF